MLQLNRILRSLLLFSFFLINYQAICQDQSHWYYFPIQKIEDQDNDSLILHINQGSELGIEESASISIWGSYYQDDPEHNTYELGAGFVESVGEGYSVLKVFQLDSIYINDLAAVYLITPDINPELMQLIRYSISYHDSKGEAFYQFDEIYTSNNPELDNQILAAMVDDIHILSEEKRPLLDDEDLTYGRFKGSTMFNQLDSVNVRSLKSCLRYIGKYPAKYAGKSNSIGVTYATWLLEGSSFTDDDLNDYLLESIVNDNVPDFAIKFAAYLLSEELAIAWGETAVDLDDEQGKWLANSLITLYDTLNYDNNLGWAYYHLAKIEKRDPSPTANNVSLAKALTHFTYADNNKGLGYVYNQMGENFEDMKSYEFALPNYQKGLCHLTKFKNQVDNDTDVNYQFARSHYLLGNTHLELLQYDSSIYYLQKMLDLYTSMDDTKNIGISMENLADAYGESGDCKKAIEVNKRRIELYTKSDNEVGLADAYFDIGYNYNGNCEYFEESIPYYQKSYDLHLALADTSMAALSISNIGQGYWSLKILDKAIENHEKAIALAEQSNDMDRLISSLNKLADLYKENGNPKKGLEAYDRIIVLIRESGDVEKLVEIYNDVGDVYKDAKDYLKAIEYYQFAVTAAQSRNDLRGVASGYYNIADVYFKQSQYNEAKEYYEKSMALSEQVDDQSNVVYCLANISVIMGIQDQYDQAEELISKALKTAKEIGDDNIIAFCTYKLAETSNRQLNYQQADSLYSEAYSIYERLGNHSFQSIVLQSMADLLINQGMFEEAEKEIKKAQKISEENNDRINIANCYSYLADLQTRVHGEFDKAMENQLKAKKLYEEIDNTWGIGSSYTSMGNIYNLRGDYQEAIVEYNKSDSLFQILNSQYNRAVPINNIGIIYMSQGDYDKALKQFQIALKILDDLDIKDEGWIRYVGNIGRAYFEKGENKLAEEWLNRALDESRKSGDIGKEAYNLMILGGLKIGEEQFKLAEEYLAESYKLMKKKKMKTDIGRCQVYLGKLYYLLKNVDKSNLYMNEAIETSKFLGVDKYLWEAYYYQGLVARDAGDLPKAKETLILSIEALERIQSRIVGGAEAKKIFASGDKQVKVYSSLVDVLIELGEVELALQYLERSNVEALRNKFNQLNIAFTDDEANKTLDKERELKKKLDNIDRTLAEEKASAGETTSAKIDKLEKNRSIAENEYLKFVNTTINTNPELSKHFSGGFHPRKLKTDKNRRLIPDNLIVLSYLPSDDKLYIFAATSDTVIAKVVNVGLSDLEKNIKYIYNFTSKHVRGHNTDALRLARGDNPDPLPSNYNTTTSNYKNISQELFNWLVSPVLDEIDKKPLVAVIPTGVLHFLPFQLLGQTTSNGKFEYIIEHYTIFYAHTLEMLYQRTEENKNISILAFGNADNTLPASETEVNDLKIIYPDSEVLLRDAATEERVKSYGGEHNILHLATHGNLDYFDYNKSYLTLAPNQLNQDDGKLTIEEVWEIEDIYSYQMVTLSACETAVTNDYSTGWAVSPASSFIDAGTPTVVASLWAVNDASTALLMKYFYENLKTMKKVDALRMAQIKLSNHPEFSHPYYWSPFILIGNWK